MKTRMDEDAGVYLDPTLQNNAEWENEVKAGCRGWRRVSGITRLKKKMMGIAGRAATYSLEKARKDEWPELKMLKLSLDEKSADRIGNKKIRLELFGRRQEHKKGWPTMVNTVPPKKNTLRKLTTNKNNIQNLNFY